MPLLFTFNKNKKRKRKFIYAIKNKTHSLAYYLNIKVCLHYPINRKI